MKILVLNGSSKKDASDVKQHYRRLHPGHE